MQVDRRQFLSGLGVTLALPWLESSAMAEAPRSKRLVCVGNHLGFYPGNFFRKQPARITRPPPRSSRLRNIGMI